MKSIQEKGITLFEIEIERYKLHVGGDDGKMSELKELTVFNDGSQTRFKDK